MANLTPTAIWGDVFQIEKNTPVLGGAGGVANRQAQELANRTQFLYENMGEEFAPTYAALRAYNGSATRMQVGGRTNYFDGAGGIVVRTGSQPDNDGTVWVDALGRSWERQFSGPVDIRWWGAKGGNYNSSPALQAAYNYLVSTGNGGTILVPPAPDGYRLDTPLNFTDAWVPITIKGMSGTNIPSNRPNNFPYGSLFWANTGGVCIDIAGRCNFGLEDIVIDTFDTTKCPTPSRIGVLGARTTTSQDNQNHHFKNVAIFMKSQRPSAPSIAHYAYGTELGYYENCWYFADLPAAYCLANVLGVTSPHRTLVASGVSATANTGNGCRFVTVSPSDPAIWFDGTYDNSFKQSYFYNESGVFTNRPALLLTGNNHSLSVDTFQCEEFANVFEQYGSLFNSKIKGFVTSTSYATAASEIGRFTGAAITVDNNFEIETGGIGVAYEAYKGTTAASSVFANNKFKLNQTGGFNVSFGASSNVGNLHFDKWTDDVSVLLGGLTNSTNITVNGKQKTIGAVNVSEGFVFKYEAKPNSTANSILSFTVPNGDIAYCYFVDYVINSSAKEAVKTGRVQVSVARKTDQAMVLTAEKLHENTLQAAGSESISTTFSVSGIFDPATGTQYAFLTCNANSSAGGTSYIRGSVKSLGASLLNSPIYGNQNIIIGTV